MDKKGRPIAVEKFGDSDTAFIPWTERRCEMKIKVRELGVGLHPSEKLVEVTTTEGPAAVPLDYRTVVHGHVDVGYPLASEPDRALVELPQETINGMWRVWVPRSEIVEDAA